MHCSFLTTGVRHELDLVVNPVVIHREMMDVGAIEGAMTDSTINMFLMPSSAHRTSLCGLVGHMWGGRELNRIHATNMRECD